ncbi:MAG: hypothetical protein JSV35_00150 [Candidatus Bathyarchaeota archaeon]|nr:MAG: hypothetical protein JSV35_00150 [Candidatus Bathyarchaeota archaeon]
MNSLLSRDRTRSSQYVVFTEYELLSLVICITLDVSEYIVAILLLPVVGDLLDVFGIIMCFVLFRLIGIISLFELVPGVDVFPVFIITWLSWYFIRRRRLIW